jgi:hypothetical protein
MAPCEEVLCNLPARSTLNTTQDRARFPSSPYTGSPVFEKYPSRQFVNNPLVRAFSIANHAV